MKDELKQYYANISLTDEEKSALSSELKTAAEISSANNSRAQLISAVHSHRRRIMQVAAVITLGCVSVAATTLIDRDTLGRVPDKASASASAPAAENVITDKYGSFYYYDPAFDAGTQAAFDTALDFLFEYGGCKYYLSNMRSTKIFFVFDNGEVYSLRKIIDLGLISAKELASSEYLLCMRVDNQSGESIPLNNDKSDLFLNAGGRLRIENRKLVKY